MNEETLESYVRSYIESQPKELPEVSFAWQGGEPTLMGLDFFKRVVELQEKHKRSGTRISNSLQTNGTLLDDEWGAFLGQNKFLVGLSIDGPRDLHDRYRFDTRGRGTFDDVLRGLDILKAHNVDFNTLTVLNNLNSRKPREVYDFLVEIGSCHLQFIPLVEMDKGILAKRSVPAVQFGRFLSGVFDRWLAREHVGQIFVQHFDMMLSAVLDFPASICVHAPTCGRALAIEHTGDVYSCDHYVEPENHLGNVKEETFSSMLSSPLQTTFGQDKYNTLPTKCLDCEYLRYCYGGCPKDRHTDTGEKGKPLNTLCRGYEMFYAHSQPVFQKMAVCIQNGRPPADYALV